MQLASTPRASSLRMKTRARAGRVFRACPAGRPCVCGSGHPGQEPVLGPARWPLEGRGRAWFTPRPSLGPGAQELSASVRHGSDSGPRTHIRWEAPGCQKLAQDCHEEKPHGSFLLVFSRHFLICMFTEPRPCSETCASSLPAGVGSAARGRPSPAVGLAGARRLHLSGAQRLHLSREALCCRLRGRHSCFSSGSLSLRSERVHAWRCFAFLANAKDSEEGLARLASLHDVPKRRPQIQGGTLAMS